LSQSTIHYHIKNRTQKAFGVSLSPHLFRDCAATSVAIEDPHHVRIAMNILGHHSLATTQRYYDQSQMLAAGRHYQSALIDLRRAGLDETSDDNMANHREGKRAHG
jgi:site-specific recombinase XerD